MEGTPPSQTCEAVAASDLQELGGLISAHDIPLPDELPSDNLREAYELFLRHGSDHQAVRRALGLTSLQEVVKLESDLVGRACRRLSRISHTKEGLADALQSWTAAREARTKAQTISSIQEERHNATGDVAVASRSSPPISKEKTPPKPPPARARRPRPRSRAKTIKNPPKNAAPGRPANSDTLSRASPLTNREMLKFMGDLVTARGRDPLTLLQGDWTMQRAFWLLTTTDAPVARIRPTLGRRVQIGAFIDEIMDTLYGAAPDILGFAPPGDDIPPPPALDDRWVEGEKHLFIGRLAALQDLDFDKLFRGAPQQRLNFSVLAVPGISLTEARARLGVSIAYISTAATAIINKFADFMPEAAIRALRVEVRRALAQRPLPPADRSEAAPAQSLPWRQTIRQMHDIATAHRQDPQALLSSHSELHDLYPLLVDAANDSEAIMAQAGINPKQLDTLQVRIQTLLPEVAPSLLGFPDLTDAT